MNAAIQTDTSTHTRLVGARLTLARVAWFVIVGLSLGVLAVVIPTFFQLSSTGGQYADALRELRIPPLAYAIYHVVIAIIQLLIFTGVAVLLFWRRSDDWMAIFVSIVLVTFGGYSGSYLTYVIVSQPSAFRVLVFLIFYFSNAVFVTFLYIFPDGRFAPRWVRWPVYAWVLWSLVSGIFPDAPFSPYTWPSAAFFLVVLAAYAGSVAVQNYRLRHYYTATQKQQTKWMLAGLLISLVGGYLLFMWPPLMFPSLNGGGVPALIFDLASRLIGSLSLMAVPVGIAFSMFRYRLWDVDFLINRSLVYGALTAGLVVLFVAGFGIVQLLFQHLHEGMNAGIALAVSGVVFGLLFMPARRRLQRYIDQRLYGIRIDYNQTPAPADTGAGIVTVGTRLGAYEITGALGKGGMAEVYKGQHTTLGREVAIKTLPAHLAQESDFRKRFEREARTIAALKHPNIVELFDSGEVDGTYYMVMEYIRGGDLSDYIRQTGQLPLAETRRLVTQIGGALDYAHQQGIVHRDVKPSNVLLQPLGDSGSPLPVGEGSGVRSSSGPGSEAFRPVLTDFGIARIMGGTTRITRTGIVGTFDYMAPEQIRDATDVDGRADIYSLGVMLFQMLAGRLPFTASNPGAMLIAHLNQPAPNPREFRADIPEEVAEATLKAMEKDPTRRFQTAGEFATALA